MMQPSGTIAFKAHPVYCGAAYRYVGVQKLLELRIGALVRNAERAAGGFDLLAHA